MNAVIPRGHEGEGRDGEAKDNVRVVLIPVEVSAGPPRGRRGVLHDRKVRRVGRWRIGRTHDGRCFGRMRAIPIWFRRAPADSHLECSIATGSIRPPP
jgi:hypothetical protein